MQEVNVSNCVKLLDSPGVVASPTNPKVSLALRSLTVEDDRIVALEAVGSLLKQCDQTLVRRISITRNTNWVFIFKWLSESAFPPRLRFSITSLTSGTLWSFWPCWPRSVDTCRRADSPTRSRRPQFSLLIWLGDYFNVFIFPGRGGSFILDMRTKMCFWISLWRLQIQLWSMRRPAVVHQKVETAA